MMNLRRTCPLLKSGQIVAGGRSTFALAYALWFVVILILAPCSGYSQKKPGRAGARQFPRIGKYKQSRLQELPPLVQKVISSSRTISYRGTRYVQLASKNGLVGHVENVWREGAKVRVEFPPNSPFRNQVIIEDGSTRRRFILNKRTVQVTPTRGDDALIGIANAKGKINPNRLQISPGGTVAGIQTELITFRGPMGRVRQQLWADPESGAILKRIGFGAQGQEIASMEFTSIELNARISPNMFNPPISGAVVMTPLSMLAANAKRGGFPNLSLPESSGFRLESSRLAKKVGVPVLIQVYEGPAGRLSLIEVRANLDSSTLQSMGNRRLKAAIGDVAGVTVVLIGAYPENKLYSLLSLVHK